MTDALYSYDRVSGVLLGTTAYVDNPERPDAPLQPAFSTPVSPPDVPAGEAAVWTGTSWGLQPDHRGERWWNGTAPILIDAVGDPTALGLTATPIIPPPPPPSSCSKLGLKRAFVEKGWWETVRGMIAGNPEFAEDWNLAVDLQISDPLIGEAVIGLAQLGLILSDADVQDLVTRANVLVRPAANPA